MGLVIRQSLKSSVGFYIGVILGAVNTLFVSTRFLNPDQLAISRLLLENSLIFAAFAHLGTPNISDRFFSRFKNNEKQNSGFLLILIFIASFGCLLFSSFYFLFHTQLENYYINKSSSIIKYLWITIPMTWIWTFSLILEAYSRANGRTAIPTFLRETVFRILNIFLIILFGLGCFSFETFILLFTGLMFLMLISLLVYIKMLGKLYINFKFIQISKKLFKEMLLYGLILILGGIGVNLILFLDRNIIANQIGTIAVAIFVVSSYISSIIEIPAKAIRQISAPIMSEAIFKNNNDKVEELYNKSALNLMLIGGLMFLLVSLNVDQILSLLPKSNIYMKGKWIVIILGFCKWIDMSLGLNSEMIAFSKYFKINTYLVISLAILAVFLNYLLIPIFGVEGSAFATGLVTITSSVFRMWYVNLKFKISPYSDKTLTVILILLFCGLVGYVTPIFGNSFFSISSSILFKSSLVIFVFVFLCLKFAISSDFSNLFSSIMLKFRKLN